MTYAEARKAIDQALATGKYTLCISRAALEAVGLDHLSSSGRYAIVNRSWITGPISKNR